MRTHFALAIILLLLTPFSGGCTDRHSDAHSTTEDNDTANKDEINMENGKKKATFGAGCFWCVEAVFQRLKGVDTTMPGYSGGHVKKPSYKEVCSGTTGHAEVIRVIYDPEVISYDELLEVFWTTHDPTTLNRQGNDVGTQYRSVIFYHDDRQRELAEKYKAKLNEEGVYDDPVVTEISEFETFYKAEEEHFNYYDQNRNQPYCSFVIAPKIEKLERVFGDKLKE